MEQEKNDTRTCATTCTKHVNHMTSCSFPPPRTSQLQATSHIPGLNNVNSVIVLRDVRGSQSEPLPLRLAAARSRPSRSPPRAASAADGFVREMEKKETTPQRTPAADPLVSNAGGKLRLPHPKPVTSSTPHTRPARQVVVCLVNNCHKDRLGRTAPTTA